jgi:hypothetical protein
MNAIGRLTAMIVIGPIAILVLGIGGCEATKAYYDWQVRQMCMKDGGIAIYEYIEISPAIAASMGRVDGHLGISIESSASPSDVAFLRGERNSLKDGEPSIGRHEQSIVRRNDEKVVARIVRYWRTGGDFPFTVSHPSAFSCPGSPQYYAEIAKVFIVKGESK